MATIEVTTTPVMHVFPLHHRVMFSGDQNILITPTALNPIIDVGATWIITVTPQQNNQCTTLFQITQANTTSYLLYSILLYMRGNVTS